MQGSVAPLLVGGCIVIETVEQVLYRMGSVAPDRGMRFIAPAVGLHALGLALWYFLLRVTPLGVALPLMGAQYITIALAGKVLFREPVDLPRWIGIAVIVAASQ